jgi:SAM-dependent methyltransferase
MGTGNERLEGLMRRIEDIISCLKCRNDIRYRENSFHCTACTHTYSVVNGIPRFVPQDYWKFSKDNSDLAKKTKNYFGFEWDYFKDLGFIPDDEVPPDEDEKYHGGLISHRVKTFDVKCRLSESDLGREKVVLDAGCGNGRYTYEAAVRGESLVIGVDIGYGAVKSAYENNKSNKNVVIIQADLFNLPFKDEVFDACFSNGVLMHTGDATKAFSEISRTIKEKGVFVVNVYHKLNPIWEFNDRVFRKFTTELSVENILRFSKAISSLSRVINRVPYGFQLANLVLRIQPTMHHMFDWYSAPVATHHTYDEVAGWFRENGFALLEKIPQFGFWSRPWAVNLKGVKVQSVHDRSAGYITGRGDGKNLESPDI